MLILQVPEIGGSDYIQKAGSGLYLLWPRDATAYHYVLDHQGWNWGFRNPYSQSSMQ